MLHSFCRKHSAARTQRKWKKERTYVHMMCARVLQANKFNKYTVRSIRVGVHM